MVGATYGLRAVTKFGDAVLVNDGDQSIHLLQTGSGELDRIAGSAAEFERLADAPENANEWFMAEILDLNEAVAKHADDLVPVPGDGECLSYKHPPCLGGSASAPDNFEVSPIPVHFGIMGQIHEQTRYAPPGTKVKIDLSKMG